MRAREVQELLHHNAEGFCRAFFPNGKLRRVRGRAEWWMSDLANTPSGESCKTVLTGPRTGYGADFATGIAWKNLLDMLAQARHGGKVGPAMREAIEWLGRGDGAVGSFAPQEAPLEEPLPASAILPIPDDAPPLVTKRCRLGKPDRVFTYFDADDRPCFHVCRWDATAGRDKAVRPCTLHRRAGRLVWEWQTPPAPWMLYRLNDIAANPSRPVLLTEGEGVADAVRDFGLELCSATWCGGCGGVNAADLSPLRGRAVTLWPDADPAGASAMVAIARRLWLEHHTLARIVQLPAGLPLGFDLADAWPSHWRLEDVEALIDQARPMTFTDSKGRTAA